MRWYDCSNYETKAAVCRDDELKNLIVTLLMPNKSAMITGPAGCGKTALIEELAYRIQKDEVPSGLKGKRILGLSATEIVNNCGVVGKFEKRIMTLMDLLEQAPEVILFVDEIHTAIGLGNATGSNNDLANILKPYLDRGTIKMIGATTDEEYEKIISRDSAFKRRFERIQVKEPQADMLGAIIENRMEEYSRKLGVEINFTPLEKQQIIDTLIKVTDSKRRVYNDIVANPALVISIIEKAFGLALYYEANILTKDHIAEAIETCDRLYERPRQRESKKLAESTESQLPVNDTQKIIKFHN